MRPTTSWRWRCRCAPWPRSHKPSPPSPRHRDPSAHPAAPTPRSLANYSASAMRPSRTRVTGSRAKRARLSRGRRQGMIWRGGGVIWKIGGASPCGAGGGVVDVRGGAPRPGCRVRPSHALPFSSVFVRLIHPRPAGIQGKCTSNKKFHQSVTENVVRIDVIRDVQPELKSIKLQPGLSSQSDFGDLVFYLQQQMMFQ